jgi:hypothetical protein
MAWPPDIVIRSVAGGPVPLTHEEIAAFESAPVQSGVAFSGDGVDRSSRDCVRDGELPGVRKTMDEQIAQEVAGGCPYDVAAAQVGRIADSYDRDVRSGRDPYPRRRD